MRVFAKLLLFGQQIQKSEKSLVKIPNTIKCYIWFKSDTDKSIQLFLLDYLVYLVWDIPFIFDINGFQFWRKNDTNVSSELDKTIVTYLPVVIVSPSTTIQKDPEKSS